MAAAYTDAVLLLGDSITQAWSDGSIAQRLSEFWLRRLDILNRGYGGYNSEWGIPVMEQVFPTRQEREEGRAQEVQLLTIWFGANDAVHEDRPQYVPLEKYMANLVTLVQMVRDPSSKWYSPNTRIVLISAPPIVEDDRLKGQMTRWREYVALGGATEDCPPSLDRDVENTERYAAAAVEVGRELGIPTVDLWHAVVNRAGGNDPDKLRPYFLDGLHFSPLGYSVLFDELTTLVLRTWPEMEPGKIPMRLPHWGDIDPKNPRGTIGGKKPKIPRSDLHHHDEL